MFGGVARSLQQHRPQLGKILPPGEKKLMSYYPSAFLYKIRNHIPIDHVITNLLNLQLYRSSKLLRFRCPRCHNFHTATKAKTNLARCFDCRKNFNPIDLVMAVGDLTFIEAVEYLKKKASTGCDS